MMKFHLRRKWPIRLDNRCKILTWIENYCKDNDIMVNTILNDLWSSSTYEWSWWIWIVRFLFQDNFGDVLEEHLILGEVWIHEFYSIRLKIDKEHPCEETQEEHGSNKYKEKEENIRRPLTIVGYRSTLIEVWVNAYLKMFSPIIKRCNYKQRWHRLGDVIEVMLIVDPRLSFL